MKFWCSHVLFKSFVFHFFLVLHLLYYWCFVIVIKIQFKFFLWILYTALWSFHRNNNNNNFIKIFSISILLGRYYTLGRYFSFIPYIFFINANISLSSISPPPNKHPKYTLSLFSDLIFVHKSIYIMILLLLFQSWWLSNKQSYSICFVFL